MLRVGLLGELSVEADGRELVLRGSWRVRSLLVGTCLGPLSLVRCYSTDPDKYALLGVETVSSSTQRSGPPRRLLPRVARLHGILRSTDRRSTG
jgi:hypothetical protein